MIDTVDTRPISNGVRVLSIGADRSRRGILFPGTPASVRQLAYAKGLGALDIIGFSRAGDGASTYQDGELHVYPTGSKSRWLYIRDALRVAKSLPKPDVVTSQDPFEAGMAAWLVARRFKVPLHVQIHTDFLNPAYSAQSPLNRIRVHIARFILKRASGIRVVSQRIADSLITNNFQLTTIPTVLPIFTDLERFKNITVPAELSKRFSEFKYRLLVVSRLEPEKNPCLALRSFAAAAPEDACLIIVGTGSERTLLGEIAHELGIADRVFFEGEQDPAPYYALADLVLVTSHYEGYGLVIIEALASGTPVLSTDVGVAREAGAIVAEAGEYSDALQRWIENGSRTATLNVKTYVSFDEYVRAYCADIAIGKIERPRSS